MTKQFRNNNSNISDKKGKKNFSLYIKEESARHRPPGAADVEKTEPLVILDYEDEIRIKHSAFTKFLKDSGITVKPETIIKSPRPRKYRATSKRKVFESKGKFYFLYADESYPSRNDLFRPSLLEPDEHRIIFEYLCRLFNEPGYTFLSRSMNFVIIRGSYTEFSVIFNINKINADVIKKLKNVSEKLKELEINIVSAFSYYDPTRSEYYFETERPEKEVAFKKFFGPEYLFLKYGDKKFSYHPTSFSQINESIIPLLAEKAESLLKPGKDEHFYDLYCGYGLFACNFAKSYAETTGIEASAASIKSAVINAKYFPGGERAKFLVKRITAETLEQSLSSSVKEKEVFLLDPPRNGTEKDVISVIAGRIPFKALHIFCGVDEIPAGIEEWEKCGYKLISLSPMDLFPGSPNLETLALLSR